MPDLLPDRAEAVRRLAVHLGPGGSGVLPSPPAAQLRWHRPVEIVPGWVEWAVDTLRRLPRRVRVAVRPVPPGAEQAVWAAAPGWTVLARLTAGGHVRAAVLVADANPGAVTDLTVPRLAGPVAEALRGLLAAAGEQAAPDSGGWPGEG